jgi:hypothetical protein
MSELTFKLPLYPHTFGSRFYLHAFALPLLPFYFKHFFLAFFISSRKKKKSRPLECMLSGSVGRIKS